MNAKQFHQVRKLFVQIVNLPDDQRRVHLDACLDEEVRREVESLLAADASTAIHDEVLPGFSVARLAEVDESCIHPTRIGPYTILGILGQGGMGTVYRAAQKHPRREIALKVIRGGLTTPTLLRRFEHEAEILGRLRHPAIAQIFEAGTAQTEMGPQPFFAMELVHGQPLNEYIKNNSLQLSQKLHLFCQICGAIQHAHDHKILHRDLKPQNIFIEMSDNDTPNPRILDFGVARVVSSETQTATLHTEPGQLIGTVPYMSPEQLAANPADIDARADVYSLGVLLYEMLSGRLPHDVANTPVPIAIRRVQEAEPVPLTRLNPLFRGDLNTIVRKAMEKDPNRRYQSVAEFAADIQRYLRNEPIHARPPTPWYQLSKFVQRNTTAVIAATVVFVVLLLSVVLFANRAAVEARLHREADQNAYLASIAAAESALTDADPISARRYLEDAPSDLRGWEWKHLLTRLDQSVAALFHEAPINDIALLSGGRSIVAACGDGRMVTWDTATKTRTRATRIGPDALRTIAVHPTEPILLVGGDDDTLTLWDIDRREPVATRIFPDGIMHARYSADGANILALVEQQEEPGVLLQLRYLDAQTLADVGVPSKEHDLMVVAELSPDGTHIAYARGNYEVVIFDVETGEPTARFKNLPWTVTEVAWSPTGDKVYAALRTKQVYAWDVSTKQLLFRTDRHALDIVTMAISSDGAWLATGSLDQTIRIWDAATGRLQRTLLGHSGTITALAFLPNSHALLSASNDKTLRFWNINDNTVLYGHTSYVYDAQPNPEAAVITTAAWDGTIRFWDSMTAQEIPLPFEPVSGSPLCVAYSPDGSLLSAGFAGDSGVFVWETKNWTRVALLPSYASHAIAYSRDGALLAYTSGQLGGKQVIRVVETSSWEQINEIQIPFSIIWGSDLIFLDEDRILLTGVADDALVYNLHTGQQLAILDEQTARARGVALSHDGTRFGVASADHSVYIYDSRTYRLLSTLSGHITSTYCLAFSPDDTRIAVGTDSGTIRLWDAKTRTSILQLRGHTNYVYNLVFTSDGSMLVSASGDGTARIWRSVPVSQVTTQYKNEPGLFSPDP